MSTDEAIQHFNQSLAVARSSEQAYAALHRLADACVGAKLFTIMGVDMDAMLARRSYTSDIRNYPASGTKPIAMNSWFDIVHGKQESFVANTLVEIAEVFPDHELIGSLGCGSVINLPVILGGKLVATVNMLDIEHHYTEERVAWVERQLRLPAVAAVLFEEYAGLLRKRQSVKETGR
ncbi:hypothetical protein ACUNV4_13980 [Granulosicoccus sp. 3-233]|uniref:hypothetical protein n=1 Tax=Granulosicoccus sp. 3-233 TaxID=3417969 RepID=UPI003D32F655